MTRILGLLLVFVGLLLGCPKKSAVKPADEEPQLKVDGGKVESPQKAEIAKEDAGKK